MGFIGSLFGGESGNSGGAGMNYKATGPTQAQMDQAWFNNQLGLNQQQDMMLALAAQNGIGNQSNVFTQQQALANQLAQQAAGQGPNPAQDQFRQNANAIGAQTAGLIGSQKGLSPALQARLIAQQGANAGQAAAGQAATLQAQQQLGAMQALGQQQANMANLATQQVGQQQNALGQYQQAAGNQYANVLGLQGNANSSNAGVSQVTAGQQGKMFGGLLGGAGAAFGLAHGGEVPNYDLGGAVAPTVIAPSGPYSPVGPRSRLAQNLSPMDNAMNGPTNQQDPLTQGANDFGYGLGKLLRGKPGEPPGMMAGGAGDLPLIQESGLGFGAAPVALPAAHGGEIRGEAYAHKMKPVPGKAKVKGDSLENDTVKARLSPGEIIIPRTIAQHPNAPEMAAKFVAAVKAKQGRGLK